MKEARKQNFRKNKERKRHACTNTHIIRIARKEKNKEQK